MAYYFFFFFFLITFLGSSGTAGLVQGLCVFVFAIFKNIEMFF